MSSPGKPVLQNEPRPATPWAELSVKRWRWLVGISIPGIGSLLALPWLFESLVWTAWIAVAWALSLNSAAVARAQANGHASHGRWLLVNWGWSAVLLSIGFYWSPAAMAYSMDSHYLMGLLVTIPIIAWDGLRSALPFWLGPRLVRDWRWAWLPVACLTVLMESYVPGVFPWRLGYVQTDWAWTLQAVDMFGPSWSTLSTCGHAALLQLAMVAGLRYWRLFKERRPSARPSGVVGDRPILLGRGGWAVLGLVTANSLYSLFAIDHWQQRMATADKLRVGLVQVDPSYVDSLTKAQQLTAEVAGQVDVICWPESLAGTYAMDLRDLSSWESVFPHSREPQRGQRPWPQPACPLVVGGKSYVGDGPEPDAMYVSALLIDPAEQLVDRYHKRHLMPFGEFVPGVKWLPLLADLFPMSESVTQGKQAHVLQPQPGVRMGAMLCYEDMIPGAAQSMVEEKANVLVSLINGSAFESPTTLRQHRKLAQLRAVEARRFLLRCAATGETCVISPTGAVIQRLPLQSEGVLVAEVALLQQETLFAQMPWLLCWLSALLLIGLSARRQFSLARSWQPTSVRLGTAPQLAASGAVDQLPVR